MSNFYWYGGSGAWSEFLTHWSGNSGNSPASPKLNAPTSTDDVFIDSNSGFGGGGTITLDVSVECHDLVSNSGHTFTIGGGAGFGFDIYGSLTFEGGITTDFEYLTFLSTSAGETITTAGITSTISYATFSGIGGWVLQDNLEIALTFTHVNGTVNANNHNVTANDFYFYADIGYTPTVNMGTGTWEIINGGDWSVQEYSGEFLVINPETSTIKMTGGGQAFTSSGKTYYNYWADSNYCIMNGNNNTFNDFKISTGLNYFFNGGTTTIVSTFTVSGDIDNYSVLQGLEKGKGILTAEVNNGGSGWNIGDIVYVDSSISAILTITGETGGVVTSFDITEIGYDYDVASNVVTSYPSGSGIDLTINILSVSASNTEFTLSKSSGIVSCDYLDILNSNAVGGATWYAGSNSVDSGNNTGWIFTDPPVVSNSSNFFNYI